MSEFDTIIDRRNTGSLKWERYAGRDVLPLWVADMDFAVPDCVLDAVRSRLDHGILGYSVAHQGVRVAITDYLTDEHGVAADPDWLVFTPGMVPAKSQAVLVAGGPGDALMVCTPAYPPFLNLHRATQRELITVPLREMLEGPLRYTLDFEAMEAAVTERTKVFFLCNPHNPVGRVFTAEEVQKVAEFCLAHDLLLVSDEIHCDLLLEPETTPHYTALRVPGAIQERLIVLMAASKTCNIPGLSTAFAVIPDGTLRRKFQASKNTFIAEVNPLGYHATEAAYRFSRPWRQRLQAYLRGNRDRLASFLAEQAPMVRMPHMEATYLAWLDVRALNLENPQSHFEKHGLGFSPGADFGGPGHVRLNFGCPRSTLDEALRRFATAI